MVSIGAALALLVFLARFVGRRAALYAGAMLIATLPLSASTAGVAASGASTDFAAIVPRVAYAFAPWTPLVPLVFVRPRRPTRWRVALAIAVMGAIGVDAWIQRPLLSPFALPAAMGAALDDLETTPNVALALLVGALGFLVARDLAIEPKRVLDGARVVRMATGIVAVLAASALAVRPKWMPIAIVVGAVASLLLRVHAYPARFAIETSGTAELHASRVQR